MRDEDMIVTRDLFCSRFATLCHNRIDCPLACHQDDEALRPTYGTDSEEEEAVDAAEASGTDPVDAEDAAAAGAPEGDTQEARNKREALQTAREIKAAVAAAEGRYCWVVYHDGGYTAELDATEKQPTRPAKAGWGY